MKQAELAILIKARDEASAVFGKVSAGARGLAGNIGSGLKVAAAVGAGGILALGAATVSFVKAAAENQKIATQTNAVIQSTGGVAGVTAEQVNKLSASLSSVTPFDDEVIQSAQNVLLTFTAVNRDIFPRTVELAMDMSQALGQDLQSSVIQVGKALQDPVKGMVALRRVGVNFSADQEKVVASLVATGQSAKAQAMILDELQREFGGSARAAGETFAGKMAILNTQIGNVKEAIGGALLPVITLLAARLATFLAEHQADIQRLAELFAVKLAGAIQGVVAAIQAAAPTLQSVFGTMREGFDTVRPALEWILNNKIALVVAFTAIGVAMLLAFTPVTVPILAVVAVIAGLLFVIGLVRQRWDDITEAVKRHKEQIIIALAVLFPLPMLLVLVGLAIAKLVQNWSEVSGAVREFVDMVMTRVPFVREIVTYEFGLVVAIARFAWATIRNEVETAINVIRDIVRIVTALIRGDWGEAWAGVRQLLSDIWTGIVTDITLKLGFVRDVLTLAWALISGIAGKAWDDLRGLAETAWGKIRDAIIKPIGEIMKKIQEMIDMINKVPSPGDILRGIGGKLGIPGFAAGGLAPGGLTLVGERGPEIVRLPAGARVYSNADSRALVAEAMAAGNVTVTNYIDQVVITGDVGAEAARLGLAL